MTARHGLIEAGGTKFVLGVADGAGRILARHRIPTTRPEETLGQAIDWFQEHGPFESFGIAAFGPLQLDRGAPDWGHILATTKPYWDMTDVAGPFARAFGCPVAIDTDVNGAALAESLWGAGQGVRASVYLTIGTGIGGGAVVDGRILGGAGHPEMGHMGMPRHPDDLGFSGHCSFHGACLEGLASGPAIAARFGCSLSDLPQGGTEQRMIAWYLAHVVASLQAVLAPGRIIMGGGVMATPGLIDLVKAEADALAKGYFAARASEIIVPPGLGDDAGLMGAFALSLTSGRSA